MEKHQVKSAIETSKIAADNRQAPVIPVKDQAPKSVKLRADKAKLSQVYVWGNGYQGQIGVLEYQNLQPRPVLVTGLQNVKVTQIACGANHTVALTHEGKVYFWGQYVYPLKSNEPSKYGRILHPKLHSSIQREFITDVRAGSSHTLALNDCG